MLQAVAPAPSFSTRTPEVLNTGKVLSFSIRVLNTGSGPAQNVIITDIALGSAVRVNPVLPLALGDLAVDNVTAVNAGFSVDGLIVGNKYLVTVRGTYESENKIHGLALNRYIVVPVPSTPPVAFLAAHVHVDIDQVQDTWTYTVSNDEPVGSPRFVNAISLDMVAPFNVTDTPAGWAVQTDNFSYVLWYAADQALPYPHHIAPGAFLGRFQIQSARRNSESKPFSITSWNHQTNQADLTALGTILAPART